MQKKYGLTHIDGNPDTEEVNMDLQRRIDKFLAKHG